MARGKPINKQPKEPDSKFKSRVVSKLISMIMYDGKKSIARKNVYSALDVVGNDDPKEGRRYFEEAIKNLMPELEVRSRRVGGANYQIPIPVRHDRAETLALRWLISAARSSKGRPFADRLTNEIKSAYNNEGSAIKKKLDTHRMAEANKAFSHFKW
jgi:small subunit ribosomal protein S7